jgi:hypothetical protein
MPRKISQLEAATDVTALDLIQVIDIEDTGMAVSGTNKKVTAQLLAKELAKQPLEPGIVISGSSSGNAVRITQTGTGNALVVEDSANPDSTPFIVDSNGNVTIGAPAAQTSTNYPLYIESTTGSFLACGTNTAANSPTIGVSRRRTGLDSVISGDSLGKLSYFGWDGSNYIEASRIASDVDGTPGVDDMPGRLEFSTTADGASAPTERMRITSAGNVGIATTTPSSKLHVEGDLTMSSATVATSATAGTNGDVPAQVAGYLVVSINGTARKIPYYA